jgi:hypothetical protein
LDGHLRSAWYDKKCAELEWDKSKIAEELDGDFAGSGNPVFEHHRLIEVVEKHARTPLHEGMLMFDESTGYPREFLDEKNGPMRLWINLDTYGQVDPSREFKIGVDVSKGSGFSNDAVCVWDKGTQEKVAQYVDCEYGDYKLAEFAVSVARLFNNAELIWELDGGFTFYKRVEDLNYHRFYMKRSKPEEIGEGKATNVPGFKVTPQSQEQMIKQYVHAMYAGRALNRDEFSIMDCANYKYSDTGGIVHQQSVRKGKARKNHGDVVTADALAWFLIGTYGEAGRRGEQQQESTKRYTALNHPNPPRDTFAWRLQESKREEKRRYLDPTFRQNAAVF